jgi:hypothetical protein
MASSIVQHRRGTTADWALYEDFILLEGELSVQFCEDGTALLKVGDGVTPYKNLKGISASAENVDDIIAVQEVLRRDVENLKTQLESTYNVNGLEYVENKLYLTSNGEIVSDGVEIIGGGGDGSGAYVDFMLESGLDSHNIIAGRNQICNLPIRFISKKMPGDRYTGNYNCDVYVGDLNNSSLAPKATFSCAQLDENGEPKFNNIDVSPYLLNGSNSVRLTCTDKYGNKESLVYTINVISLSITSQFDDSVYIKTNEFRFDYVPTGGADVEKTVYFVIDGEDESSAQIAKVTSSAVSQTQWIKLDRHNTHGIHTLDVYVSAVINGILIVSNHLTYELMVIDETSNVPLIASAFSMDEVSQGELIDIPYTVYDRNNDTPEVLLTILHEVNGQFETYGDPQRITINTLKQHWQTRDYPVGSNVIFRISYRNDIMNQYVERSHSVLVHESNIKTDPVIENLELALSAANRSNDERNPGTWNYNGKNMAYFEDFNWKTNGWVKDSTGDTCLRVSGKAKATINFKPFEKDFKEYGKTIEIEFAVRDVNTRSAVPIRCFEKTGELSTDWLGLRVTPDTTTMQSVQSSISCNYKEEQKIRVSISVQPVKGSNKFISMYLDGVLCGTAQYSDSDIFSQTTGKATNIEIGTEDCSIDVYSIRVYNTYLDAKQVLQNYIADTSEFLTKVNIYEENDIYNNETLQLSYSKLKTKVPTVTFIGKMPKYKGDKKKKSVRMIFEHPTQPELNFDQILSQIDVQGTSSAGYVRKNWKTKHSDSLVHKTGELPAKVFCLKVDYAECTGTHNTQNAIIAESLYSEPIPVKNEDNFPDGIDTESIEKIRTTITGYPIVIFHLDTADTHLINNITKAELEQRNDVKFSSKGNFNFDKGAENVFGFTSEFDVECWEFCETENPTQFLTPFPENHAKYWEARYHPQLGDLEDAIDKYGETHDIVKNLQDEMINRRFRPMYEWVYSTARGTYKDTDGTTKSYATNTALSELYVGLDGTVYDKDTDDYRLAKFQKEFENYFDSHYTAIYYVYTFFALMTDQRAKNLFLTYWQDNPYDKDCTTGKWYPYFYDNDTCFGINNTGDLKFDYFHEDDDQLASAGYVFNGRNSVLWCNFRDAFKNLIRSTYSKLRSDDKISYNKLINQFINQGSDMWSASVYNEDANYKYISLATPESDWYPTTDATEPTITSEFLRQVRGNGEQHLKYFIQNRIKYCDSKWQCGDYPTIIATLRVFTPQRADGTDSESLRLNASLDAVPPNAAITVTPYSNMYCGVAYGADSGEGDGTSRMLHAKATQGVPITFKPDENDSYMNEKETYIYGASEISSLGDLGPLYCGKVDVGAATKLTELKIGDSNPAYVNNNLVAVSVGSNNLLKSIDVTNCAKFGTGDQKVLDVSGCTNIETILAKGTSISSVNLPEAGYVSDLQLPATISSLILKNQVYLDIVDLERYNINTLRIENCPKMNVQEFLSRFELTDESGKTIGFNISNLRLTGLNWTGENAVTYEYLELLSKIPGLTENNDPTAHAYLSGTVEVSDDMTSERMKTLKAWFPQLNIIFHNLSFKVTYMDTTGTTKIYEYTETIGTHNSGEVFEIKDPIADGHVADHHLSKESTVQHHFSLGEYKYSFKPNDIPDPSALRNVFNDTTLYIAFEQELRSYPVHFYVEDIYLGTVDTLYGHKAIYTDADKLVKPNTKLPYKFSNWSPDCSYVEGEMTCYAQFEIDYDKMTSLGNLDIISYSLDTKNKTISITSSSCTDKFCVVPPVITVDEEDYTVVSIAGISNQNLIYIELPNTLKTISASTFEDCISLESIAIPDSVCQIKDYAFRNCINLRSIKLPQGNSEFTKLSHQMLMGCILLSELDIPNTVTTLDSMSIYKCSALTAIRIPDSVNEVGMFAFKVCNALTNVTFVGIPNIIHSQAFEALPGLTAGHITFNVPWKKTENHGEPWAATAGKYTINYTE